jgi:hypothetical protein
MTVIDLAVGYAGIGAILALVAIGVGRASALDALLVLGLWPLYGPMLAGGGSADDSVDPRERALISALRRAAGTPLAAVLPDEAGARTLARRVREGRARLADLDRVLARPDLDDAAAIARVEALERGGAHAGAAAAAQRRIHTIRRLRAVRGRIAGDLEQVDEVIGQLTAQLELVRFTGPADETAAELAADLCARVESLEEVLGNDPAADGVPRP